MQWQIKEVLGAVTQLGLRAFCVHKVQSCVYVNIMHFPLLLCLGVAAAFYLCIQSNNNLFFSHFRQNSFFFTPFHHLSAINSSVAVIVYSNTVVNTARRQYQFDTFCQRL